MSREVYTYTDITKLPNNKFFKQIEKYPIITVSADLKKGFIGEVGKDRNEPILSFESGINITDLRSLMGAVNDTWSSDQAKFYETIILSEFLRSKITEASSEKDIKWLTGCLRNIDSLLSAIIILEEAEIRPEQLEGKSAKNIRLLIEAWEYLIEKDPNITMFRQSISKLDCKEQWEPIFQKAFQKTGMGNSEAVVFHDFYYITPIQEHIMQMLEKAGYKLIYLIPYDERFPFVYEIWDKTFSVNNGYKEKSQWKIEKSEDYDPYGLLFEGERDVSVKNNLEIKEYASVMEFVDDVKAIRSDGFTLYATNHKEINEILKDYYPDNYGERKILSYPIGQFVYALNKMWDEDLRTVILDNDNLIDCFSSGWLSVNGVSGKQYMQDLMHILPYFSDCKTVEDWEKRIDSIKAIRNDVVKPFKADYSVDPAISRWQEAIDNPFINFSPFSVDDDKLDVILTLLKQLLSMGNELFGDNSVVKVNEHINKLGKILKSNEISDELYDEEKNIIGNIFERLQQSNDYIAECAPSDIARALDVFISGRYDENEIQVNRPGFVRPMFFVEAEAIKNRGKAHICMCDINNMPSGNKEYIWPLTKDVIAAVYHKTNNPLIRNLIHIMDSTPLCNRYFIYSGLKNKAVTLSWISEMNDKTLTYSPYIMLITKATGVEITPAKRNEVTFNRVWDAGYGNGKIQAYDREKMPRRIIKEARMAYALCPMKYTLGYVVEKNPTFESEFQQSYAINAFISAIYALMKDKGVSVDKVYDNVISLFPSLRRSEKRQVYDYIAYDRGENDMDYGSRTECGEKYYTDERIKLHYPNQDVREVTVKRFGKLMTPDGRSGLELNEVMEASREELVGELDPVKLACSFCPHISYCRNAIYQIDQEKYYD